MHVTKSSRILHSHVLEHSSMFLRHLQRMVPQPFKHWHEIISMQAFGTGSIVIKIDESLPSVIYPSVSACEGVWGCNIRTFPHHTLVISSLYMHH